MCTVVAADGGEAVLQHAAGEELVGDVCADGAASASKPSVSTTTARKRAVASMAPTQSHADLARLRHTSELRDVPDDFWPGARVVTPVTKEAIAIRLDGDVIAWFRASGPRDPSRINAVLRSYMEQVVALTGRLLLERPLQKLT